MRRGVVFSIEGNIGSGKSTLLNILSNRIPHLKILPEPVKNWQNVGGHNILHTYYNQPKRWAYTFQSYALLTRITTFYENLNSQAINGIIFSERSIATDKQIFAKLLSQENLMN
jgi:deoxyguanosine kinase